MNKFSRDLMQGMAEAADFAEGKKTGTCVHIVEVPDMRAGGGLPADDRTPARGGRGSAAPHGLCVPGGLVGSSRPDRVE